MERTVAIASKLGLHARPAKTFVEAVKGTGIPVKIRNAAGKEGNAASLLGVMGMGIKGGDEVTLIADDPAALDTLVALLSTELD